MFSKFFFNLKDSRVPISLREFLTFLEALSANVCNYEIENFYFLARTALVKNEKHIDKFDKVFAQCFKGVEQISIEDLFKTQEIPEQWIRKLSEKILSDEEKREIESLGSFEKLMETLQKRLEEQEKRHQGGSKWIGTAGTSPFGAYGYNPEGIRIGQDTSRHKRAVKVWDKREFKDLDDETELGSRGMKIALKRLRRWARDGQHEELDLDGTIKESAKAGFLDIKTQPAKSNAIKVLIFFDVGGSMDSHVKEVEELFSAVKTAFKHLKYFYFHNCLYEGVWQENLRRWTEQVPTIELIRTYSKDYKCIFVGDASMSPYEIEIPGGANEHFNSEAGRVWLERAINQWPKSIWINPVAKENWEYTHSIKIVEDIFEKRMVPLTMDGLETGMRILS